MRGKLVPLIQDKSEHGCHTLTLAYVRSGVMSDKTQGEHNGSVFGCLAEIAFKQPISCLPIASCARLKDRLVNRRAAGSSEASKGFAEGIPA